MKKRVSIGIDVGAVSVKLAIFFNGPSCDGACKNLVQKQRFSIYKDLLAPLEKGVLLISPYIRHYGSPREVLQRTIHDILKILSGDVRVDICITGSGGKTFSEEFGLEYVNEYIAVAQGVGSIYSDVNTIFEIGAESSKYILLSRTRSGSVQILDYETNGECAAGTGSFFDQQVKRLKYSIDDVSDIVQRAKRTAPIAGRCSVFAKSDMIHAQQRGYLPDEVLKGLCEAVVRNFKGAITKGKEIVPNVAFIGGVSENRGVVEAFKKTFNLNDENLIVPELSLWVGAIGAALAGGKETIEKGRLKSSECKTKNYPTAEPLKMDRVRLLREKVQQYRFPQNGRIDAYLGIDVGSVSTNLALIDSDGELIYGIYRMTDGRPIEVVSDALNEIFNKIEVDRVEIRGVGTTGSGRELIGALVGADVVKDEITAHKTGALFISDKFLNKKVDTIFEIGGQDSKFISLRDGIVVDFSLNEACAAGTGSFLEEQAKELGIDIKGEFSSLALQSQHPLRLGERCTVFMEKELVPYIHRNVSKKDIVAGLALSVVQNYLNRVVKRRKIGEVIFFQGGTAYNDSVAAAFSTLLNKEIIVPPHNGIIGAIGAALLARERENNKKTSFRGWDMGRVSWSMKEFTCKGCTNQCIIQQFTVEGEKSYWGDKCSERYRKRTKSTKKSSIEDLFDFRLRLLFGDEVENRSGERGGRGTIGIPRVLHFYDRLPFWFSYFHSLGFDVVISSPTNQKIINRGVEASVAEPCFPIQVVHGHIMDLIEKRVDHLFLPNVVDEEDPTSGVASFICPWAQTIPLVIKRTPGLRECWDYLFYPNIKFRNGRSFVEHQLKTQIRALGIGSRENRKAVAESYSAQAWFREQIVRKADDVLKFISRTDESGVVLLGRPYNLYDSGLNLNIPKKLRDIYGVNVIPMDFLPLDDVDIDDVNRHMFWNYGRRILQAARFVRDFSKLHIIYISNFKCGPDSYIRHYIEEACGRPFLFIQIDSHANDAGIMTRIEAFLESKKMI